MRTTNRFLRSALCGACAGLIAVFAACLPLRAGEALVAVAANFAEVTEELETAFETTTDHTVTITSGSTGKLYAQIKQGAPFDVLTRRRSGPPARLEAEGDAVPGSRFTYAVGRLALWSPDAERIGADGRAVLKAGDFDHLAIANPDLAPYGLAAKQALQHFGLWDALQPKLVMGQNIGQTFSMVATGNAQLGLVRSPMRSARATRRRAAAGTCQPRLTSRSARTPSS